MIAQTKAIESLADQLAPFAWRDDANALRAKASGNCYEWYYTYAHALRPAVVVEIGVQRGYSAMAMLMGYPEMMRLVCFDNEADGFPVGMVAQQIARAQHACGSQTAVWVHRLDTQQTETLPVMGLVELAHVDGQHTYASATHDLELVARLVRPGGIIVLDDLWLPEVARAGLDFAATHPEYAHGQVPTFTKHQVSFRRLGWI